MIATALTLLADTDFGHMDFNGGWWIVMGLGMILFWGLVIVGIVWLVRALTDSPRGASVTDCSADALQILDRRLAEGEIDAEEYNERRRTLGR